MELKSNPSRILMSDVLRDRMPELESDVVDKLHEQYVHVIMDRRISGQQQPLTGLLRSVLFDVQPEVEVKVDLEDALNTVKATELVIMGFELQYGTDGTVAVPGPFTVKAARIQDVDPSTQTCVLAVQLHRVKKA